MLYIRLASVLLLGCLLAQLGCSSTVTSQFSFKDPSRVNLVFPREGLTMAAFPESGPAQPVELFRGRSDGGKVVTVTASREPDGPKLTCAGCLIPESKLIPGGKATSRLPPERFLPPGGGSAPIAFPVTMLVGPLGDLKWVSGTRVLEDGLSLDLGLTTSWDNVSSISRVTNKSAGGVLIAGLAVMGAGAIVEAIGTTGDNLGLTIQGGIVAVVGASLALGAILYSGSSGEAVYEAEPARR